MTEVIQPLDVDKLTSVQCAEIMLLCMYEHELKKLFQTGELPVTQVTHRGRFLASMAVLMAEADKAERGSLVGP